MLTGILTSWIMATALRVAKMLPKATKYPLFWSWQKSPAYCTYQFKRKKYVQIRHFFFVPIWTYYIFQGIWTYIHTGMMHVIKMHMPATDVQVLVKVKKQVGLEVTLSPCICITYGPLVCSVCLEIKLLIKWITWWKKNTHSFIWISTPY